MPIAQLRRLSPLLPLRIMLFTGLVVMSTQTHADADLWGHVLFGGDIVRQGGVHAGDPYSFTSDRPWINHEWLSEVAMHVAYAAAGARGLVLMRVAVVCGVALLAVLHLGPLRRDPVLHDASLALVILGIWGQTFTVRPQLFSVVLFAVLLLILLASTRQPRWLWTVPVLMVLWVNLHGGWLLGAATAGLWVIGTALTRPRQPQFWTTAAAAGALSIVGLLVNPYGSSLPAFLVETVGPSRPDITEWLPVFRLGAIITILWLAPMAFAAFVLLRSRERVSLPSLLVLGMLGLMAFFVARLIGFLALAAVFLLRDALDSMARAPRAQPTAPRWVHAGLWLAAAAVVAAGLSKSVRSSQCLEIIPESYPEPAAVRFITDHALQGRALTFFDWGQYAIWHLQPAVKVSIDGRRETVYSEGVLAAHRSLSLGQPEALQFVHTHRPDFAWLPRGNSGIDLLLRDGWTLAYDGPRSVILLGPLTTLQGQSPVQPPLDVATAPRCFPAP